MSPVWEAQTSKHVCCYPRAFFVSAGAVVVFDVTTSSPGKYVKTFTDNTGSGCGSLLHRPDYPVWGKDGRLYINGFKAFRNVSSCHVHHAVHLRCLACISASQY